MTTNPAGDTIPCPGKCGKTIGSRHEYCDACHPDPANRWRHPALGITDQSGLLAAFDPDHQLDTPPTLDFEPI